MAVIPHTEAQRITEYLNLQAEPDVADLAFIFGTSLTEPAALAAGLFFDQVVSHIVVTGGYNPHTGVSEALVQRQALLEAGIPAERLIVESESRNTLENVRFALPAIAECISLADVQAIVVIAKWYHCRRAAMTLKHHMPHRVRYYPCTYNPSGITPENWHQTERTAIPVLKNWQSIPVYLKQGDLEEIRLVNGAYV